jgi:hypothetical protein
MCQWSSKAALIASIAVLTAINNSSTRAFDDSEYPNWKGQWIRRNVQGLGGQPSHDQTKPWGFGQQAPLTPEYAKVLQDSIVDQEAGGQGNFAGSNCLAFGMPMMMMAFFPQEYVITPGTTHIIINNADHSRRIFTDGRGWPKDGDLEPTFAGYSIGKWIDLDGDGVFDVLEVETRGPFKDRAVDLQGLPMHRDNQSIFKERIYLDKSNPNILHDEITTIDNALTRPWTVDKLYIRNPNPRPMWPEYICAESNQHVRVGTENYMLSGDGFLMPTHKNQAPPDSRYFKKPQQ